MGRRRRQLHLGAFMRPASIHTGAWRYPGAYVDATSTSSIHGALHPEAGARALRRFFMADHLAVLNMPLDALKRAATGP